MLCHALWCSVSLLLHGTFNTKEFEFLKTMPFSGNRMQKVPYHSILWKIENMELLTYIKSFLAGLTHLLGGQFEQRSGPCCPQYQSWKIRSNAVTRITPTNGCNVQLKLCVVVYVPCSESKLHHKDAIHLTLEISWKIRTQGVSRLWFQSSSSSSKLSSETHRAHRCLNVLFLQFYSQLFRHFQFAFNFSNCPTSTEQIESKKINQHVWILDGTYVSFSKQSPATTKGCIRCTYVYIYIYKHT